MSLTFDAGPHEYRWDGRVVPSVTQLIKPYTADTLRFVDPAKLERARQMGVAVHLMVELHLLRELASIPAWQEPYMDAWLRFEQEQEFAVIATETKLYHPTMGYAGTPDLIGTLKASRRRPAVIDLKRSLWAGRAIGLQTSGYKRLWNADPDHIDTVVDRFALVLHDDRTYTLTQYADPQDDAAFLAAVTLWKWQRQGA